jgi:hypothetical protein
MRWLVAIVLGLALVVLGAMWFLRPRHAGAAAPDAPVAGPDADAAERPLLEPLEAEREGTAASSDPEEAVEQVVEDLPPEEELEEPWLPDPVQLGPAMLDLRLVDSRTGDPVGSFVQLWRIDAPGNESWTEGDQLQQQAQVPAEGWLFTQLPEGRYRLVCHAQAWDAQPPEVTVTAPRTRLDVPIEVPARFRVRVVVCDRYGQLVPRVTLESDGSEELAVSAPWRFERQPRGQEVVFTDESVSEEAWWSSEEQSQPAEGVDLGLHGGATRGAPRLRVLTLSTPDGGRVRVRVPSRGEGDVRLVAVALPVDEVAARVRFPGGAPAQAEVEVFGQAVEQEPGPPGQGWQQAPVQIQARLEGYQPVHASWTAAAGELPWIELEPDG